eukprot:7490614-Pyramimonas_sp.AAC.2
MRVQPAGFDQGEHTCAHMITKLHGDCTEQLKKSCTLKALRVGGMQVEQRVHVFTMCGRAFVRHLLGCPNNESAASAGLTNESTPPFTPPVKFQHVVMNLPATAIEFLGKCTFAPDCGHGLTTALCCLHYVFKGAFKPEQWDAQSLPMVHCYLFAKTVETSEDIIKRGEHHLGGSLLEPVVHNVRDVAPNKHMYCLSFKLSEEVAFASTEVATDEQAAKRMRVAEGIA